MQPLRGILFMTMIVGATLVVAISGQVDNSAAPRPATVESLPAPRVTSTTKPFVMIGARSCASTACHGSVRPDRRALRLQGEFIRRDEYVFWSDHDPHARSLLTLESDRSARMYLRLGIKDAQGKVVDERGYNNCRACHATQVTAPLTRTVSYESVSCEACHGPAEKWNATHYQRTWNEQVAADSGFVNTKNLEVRAQRCVQCHVGGPNREVNHDLIAAGHPALKFEFAAYHDMLPKHWNDSRERQQTVDFELELWQAGQRQVAAGALALTHARLERSTSTAAAERAPVKAVWPEFAEYDCFACHHELVDGSWQRQALGDARGLPGWNLWNLANVAAGKSPALDGLRAGMPAQLRVTDESLLQKVAAAHREVGTHQELDDLLAVDRQPTSWDGAAQAYLQLAARFRARQDAARKTGQSWAAEGDTKQKLLRLRQDLAFDENFDSPRATVSREEMLQQVKALHQQLSPGDR